MSRSIYIAGPMNGDPNYKNKFDAAESYLTWKGWTVLNPACLPEGLRPDAYMPICLAMLNAADAVCLLKGWDNSLGAELERRFAYYQTKEVFCGIEEVPDVTEGTP